MNGKVCVVTGATSGIGKAAATALARMGAQVVLVGRDHGRASAAANEIGSASAPPPKVEIADLASMEQVRSPLPISTSMTPTWSVSRPAGAPMPTASWPTSCSPASLPAGSAAPG